MFHVDHVPTHLDPDRVSCSGVVLWKYWFPVQIKTAQINAGSSRKQVIFELVGIPLVSFVLIAWVMHITGNDTMLSSMAQGLVWCGQGLLWDLLHPFAYGFGISFS